MEQPSFRGFTVQTLPFTSVQMKQASLDRISSIEKWAIENLKPRQAATTVVQFDDVSRAAYPIQANISVLRHGDYDTGRANLHIHLRETISGRTRIWDVRHDVMSEGYVTDFVEHSRYIRAQGREGNLVWVKRSQMTIEHPNPADQLPALRVPELYRQCFYIDLTLTSWLTENCKVAENPDIRPVQIDALFKLLNTPLIWLATHPEEYEVLRTNVLNSNLKYVDGMVHIEKIANFHREITSSLQTNSFRWVGASLKAKNQIATAEHFALYDRLKRSKLYVEKRRKVPLTRPISRGALMRLQRRWVNAVAKLIPAFEEK